MNKYTLGKQKTLAELCDKKDKENLKLLKVLSDISNMCVGEIAMNYKLDSQYIGELIYKATGLTNPELNKLANKE